MQERNAPAQRRGAATTSPAVRPPRPLLRSLRARGFRLLQLADFLAILAVLVLTNLVRFGAPTPTSSTGTPAAYAVAFTGAAFVHVLIAYFSGLYEPELRLGSTPQLPRVAGMAVVATLIVATAELMLQRFYIPRASLPALPVLAALALAGNRRLARSLRRQREGRPLTLLVGAPDDVNLARSHLLGRQSPAEVVGETTSPEGLLGTVAATRATDVLLLSPRVLDELYPEPLTTLERQGIGVLQRVTARDTLLGLRGVREVGGMPFVALRTHTLPVSAARFKRVLEFCALVILSPLVVLATALVGLYILAVAGRPVLFHQERVGRDGVLFRMHKFRTMYRDAEGTGGAVLASSDDPRVIPACRWLRATRLDELPQLWNVLRGEMSVVGPRPERPELTQRYETLIPGYSRRHEIPPGLTGLAQIHGRYHTDPEYKLGHDLQYLVNWSPVLDLQILFRTVWVVLTRRL